MKYALLGAVYDDIGGGVIIPVRPTTADLGAVCDIITSAGFLEATVPPPPLGLEAMRSLPDT